MKTVYNEKLHKNEWIVSTWYEKLAYCVGTFYVIVGTVAFFAGVISAIIE